MTNQETVKQIARDICRGNKICTCIEKDGHCVSVMSIAERLAKQGYKPPNINKIAIQKEEVMPDELQG